VAEKNHVSELLAEVFRRGGMKRAMRRAQAVLLWPQVAGGQLAKFTRARNMVDGVLFVDVPDSETAMHLTLQRQRFLDVFQGKFGAREVRDIRFQTGRPIVAEESEPEPENVTVDPHALSRITRELGELELPEELSKPAMQAARSMLVYRARRKAQGWEECSVCGAPTPEPGMCSTCAHYASEPQVLRAAELLAVHPVDPLPWLSEDQRAVAVTLAHRKLELTLSELLPQVVADQDLRPQLETVARCYLALGLGKSPKDLADADLASLPPRVARVLGYWS
jgi:predicted nucleic acid-binding Zn ribbon protein